MTDPRSISAADLVTQINNGLGGEPVLDRSTVVTILKNLFVSSAYAAGAYHSFAFYDSRAEFVAATIPDSVISAVVMSAAGPLAYVADAAGTAVTTAGGRKWSPSGAPKPDHYALNAEPGVTDMAAAITSCLNEFGCCDLGVGQNYAVGATISADNVKLIGQGPLGLGRTAITGLSATLEASSPLVRLGRSAVLRGMQLRYDGLTGSEAAGERVALDVDGSTYSLQRNSIVDDILFDNVGTAIADSNDSTHMFSVTLGTLEIKAHSYAAIDLPGLGTGNVIGNIYIGGGDSYTPVVGVRLGEGYGGHIQQLNIEHQTYSDCVFDVSDNYGLSIETLHLEGIDVSSVDGCWIRNERSVIDINSLSMLHNRMTADGIAIFELGDAELFSDILTKDGSYGRGRLSIRHLQVRGAAQPHEPLYPDYPDERLGLDAIDGFQFIRRAAGFETQDYAVSVEVYDWLSYASADAEYVIQRVIDCYPYTERDKINLERFGRVGWSLPSRNNLLENADFKDFVTASVAISSGSADLCSGWDIACASGTMNAEIIEMPGQPNRVRFWNTAGSGTYQSFRALVPLYKEVVGAGRLALSFKAKCATDGMKIKQIRYSLQNSGGTSGVQVVPGTDKKLQFGTDEQTYRVYFDNIDWEDVVSEDETTYLVIYFQINDVAWEYDADVTVWEPKLELVGQTGDFVSSFSV